MKKAFTLIEILVALAVLGLGLVLLLNIFPLGMQSVSYSRKLNQVALLAERKMEEAKAVYGQTPSPSSGESEGLRWTLTFGTCRQTGDITLTVAQLEIEFDWRGAVIKEKFLTYL